MVTFNRMRSRDLHLRPSLLMMSIALLVAIAWVPMTSHELLEAAGCIRHNCADVDHRPHHEVADGHYRVQTSNITLKAPVLWVVGVIGPLVALLNFDLISARRVQLRLSRATESPPG